MNPQKFFLTQILKRISFCRAVLVTFFLISLTPLLKAENLLEACTERIPSSYNLTGLKGHYWKNGVTIRIKFIGGGAFEQAKVKLYAVEWTKFANIQFNFIDNGDSDVRISFNKNGSWSYVGNSATSISKNEATMNFGWITPGTEEDKIKRVILHEFGHLLGLVHEHQSPNATINWNRDAVYKYYENIWSTEMVNENIFRKYDRKQTNHPVYDSDSIMHYWIPPEWLLRGFPVKLNTSLSKIDKQFIQKLYPR